MGLYPWQCATMQDRTLQYSTVQIQFNVTHITQNNTQYYTQNYKTQEHVHY